MAEELILEEINPTSIEGREEIVKKLIQDILDHKSTLSFTSLKNFDLSPIDFIDYKLQIKVETPAMAFGSMLHCLVLEPDEFDKRYYALDDTEKCAEISGEGWKEEGKKPRATKAFKEWKAGQIVLAGERTVVSTQDHQKALIIANNVKFNRASSKRLAAASVKELKIEWEYGNFKFKGFIDGDGEKETWDLKMMPDASKRKAQRTIIDRKIYLQAVMYLIGNSADIQNPDLKKPYYIIAVDQKGGVSVHKLANRLIEEGKKELERLIDNFNRCVLEKAWNQSYDFWGDRWDGSFEMEMPAWMY